MTNLNKETMKRPSEYMTMTDGFTQHDYKQALNKYIDYLEAENKQLILSGVGTSLDLVELEKKIDKALDTETSESLKEWLHSKRLLIPTYRR
jgi:uncharacterized protein YegL